MRHPRVWSLVLAGMVAAFAIGFAAFVAFTRTQAGRERVLEYTLSAVGGRLNGYLHVARLDGNLVTGAKLYELELRDADSVLIVKADSAYANYALPSFFGGDVVLRELVLYRAELALRRFPGDSLWNYQEVLLDTARVPGDGPARATILRNVRLVDAQISVRLPWTADTTASATAQEVELREALADSSRVVVGPHPGGGHLRTMRFEVDDAEISDLVIAGDVRGGTFLRVESARGRAQLYRGDPLDIRELAGELAMHRGKLRYSFPTIALPASRLGSSGVIDMRGPYARYDLTVAADSVRLRDLAWLYPRMPENGRASFDMVLETRDEGTRYRFDGLRFTAPGTRLEGSFGIVVGEAARFTDVNLTARPLRVETIEAMLPQGLPVQGLHIGAVEIRSREAAAAASPAGGSDAPPRSRPAV